MWASKLLGWEPAPAKCESTDLSSLLFSCTNLIFFLEEFERERAREREKGRSKELQPGLPVGWQEPKSVILH